MYRSLQDINIGAVSAESLLEHEHLCEDVILKIRCQCVLPDNLTQRLYEEQNLTAIPKMFTKTPLQILQPNCQLKNYRSPPMQKKLIPLLCSFSYILLFTSTC